MPQKPSAQQKVRGAICHHLSRWRGYRVQCGRTFDALIALFCVSLAAYGAAIFAVANIDTRTPSLALVHVALSVASWYVVVLLFGNLELTRLLVELALPTLALKVITCLQIGLSVVLMLALPFARSTRTGQTACIVTIAALAGLVVASFVVRMRGSTRGERRNNCAMVSMLSDTFRSTNRILRKEPHGMSATLLGQLVDEAHARLSCGGRGGDVPGCPKKRAPKP